MNSFTSKTNRVLTIITISLWAMARANALNIDWSAGTGEFAVAGNWNSNAVPGSADLARITNSGVATITDGLTYDVSNLNVAGRSINNSTGTLQIVSGTLRVTGNFSSVGNNPHIGTGINALGRIEVMGGTLHRYSSTGANEAYLLVGGGGGKGYLTVTSGNVFADYLRIGSDQQSTPTGGSGQVDISGGLIVITNQWLVGRDAETGTVNITGGEVINLAQKYLSLANDDYCTVGGSSSGTGVVNIATGGLLHAAGGIRLGQAGGVGESADGTIRLNGGRLVTHRIFQGATTGTSAAKLELNGGTLEATNATHASGFIYGGVIVRVKASGITVDSAGNELRVVPGFLQDATSPGGGLTKTGAGTLRLTGANTYTGATLVQAGGLVLSTASTGGGSVTANDGSAFGALMSSAGSSLNLSGLTLNAGAGTNGLNFELGVFGNPIAPVVSVTSFTVNRTNIVNVSGAGLSVGMFTLVQFTSGTGVTADQFILNSLPTGVAATLVFESNAIKLNVTEAPSLHWNGNLSSDWDITTANWLDFATNPPVAKLYSDGSAVQFDDASVNFAVNLPAAVSPAAITVTNSVNNYVFSGPGVIAGATALRKQGSGVLTMGTTNTYSGDTTISAGTFRLGASEVISQGVAKGNLVVNGTLDLNGFNEGVNGLTGSGVIDNTAATPVTFTAGNQAVLSSFSGTIINSGGGALLLAKNGGNVLLLTGNNGHSGGTRINTGTIQMGNDGVLGSGTLTFNDGGISSDSAAARTITNAVSFIAGGTIGAVVNNGLMTLSGPVDLGAGVRNITANSDVLLSGGSSNGAMNKLGSGTLTLQGIHTWVGISEVRNGTLVMAGASVTSVDAFRPDCDIANGTARLVIGPGSTWIQDAPGGNLRVGSDGNTTATNIADIAGSLSFVNSDSASGKIVLGNGSTIAFANLLTNGLAVVRAVQKNGTGNYAEFNFNGGTLQAIADNTAFMTGLSAAYVRAGGATIDSAGFNIAIAQNLLDGGGNGGLTKNGAGALFLNGANTYSGTTLVNGGGLGGAGTISGPVIVSSGGALAPGNSIGTLTINNTLTLQGAAIMEISSDGTPSSDLVEGITTLTQGGTLIVTNAGIAGLASGDTFNLFDATVFAGSFSSITLPALSSGLSWNTNNLAVDGTISVTGTAVQPQFSAPNISGGNINFSGTGGTPGGTYYVLTSTDVALPLTNWTAIATNNFGGSGEFNFSDTTGSAQQFYIISVP